MAQDIIGPIFLITLIFLLYYGGQNLDTRKATKKSRIEIDKIDAETRREEIQVRRQELQVEMGKLAIEHKKLGFEPVDGEDAQFTIIDDTEEKNQPS